MAGGFNASIFAYPLGMLRNLGMAEGQFGQSQGMFTPDLAAPMATASAFGRMPMMPTGGGGVFDPSAMGSPMELLNPVRAGAMTQQAGQWGQQQPSLSDFLLGTATDRDQLMAMLTQLRAMQQSSQTSQLGGVLGAFGL